MGISRYLYIIWDPGPGTWYLELIGFDMVKRDPPFGTREFGTGYLGPNIWDGIFGTLQFGTRDPVPRVPLSAYAPSFVRYRTELGNIILKPNGSG